MYLNLEKFHPIKKNISTLKLHTAEYDVSLTVQFKFNFEALI